MELAPGLQATFCIAEGQGIDAGPAQWKCL
ncbi:MAG: hypothetical protein JWP81_2818 [Ferruginibacter sp.]|nr:hypothetical protein [Ferruginibacter sp.]